MSGTRGFSVCHVAGAAHDVHLSRVIKQNSEINFVNYDFQKNHQADNINWQGLENKKEAIIPLLLAYQRMLRISPDASQETALSILKLKFHSAIQIASFTRKDFINIWNEAYPEQNKLGLDIYENALKKRSSVLLEYMNIYQNNEPHIKKTKI